MPRDTSKILQNEISKFLYYNIIYFCFPVVTPPHQGTDVFTSESDIQ
jgi:hypothetical protein